MARKFSVVTMIGALVLSTIFTALVTFTPMASKEGETAHAASTNLSDIPAKHAAEIHYLISNNIISGYPDGTFKPDRKVKRSEAAKVIGEIKNLSSSQRETSFSDVSSKHWASGYIESAKNAKIINGYPDGTFRPDDNISRVESSFILTKAFNLNQSMDVYFKDMPNDKAKYDVISKMMGSGIIQGYADGTFRPDLDVTREEFAVMIARALNESFRVDNSEKTKKYVATATTPLNVRSGPGTSHSVIGSLPHASEVIVHYQYNANWAFVTSGSLTGYVSTAYLTDKPTPKPSPAPKPNPSVRYIAIDAGHGGSDSGATGNGLIEKEINLDVSKRVQKILEKSGVNVFMTRTDDTFYSLDERVTRAVNAGADTFVSIHTNSFGKESANGTETYYSTASLNPRAADSKKLAEFIHTRLVEAMGTYDRGVKTAGFRVIKANPLPAALVELAFISNKSDAQKLASDTYRDKAADAIAKGIIDYYEWKEK